MSSSIQLPNVEPRENLAGSVYRALREAITTNALPPGYRLREVPLARHFGVSTTPVREALHRLEREGLVEISPRRGAVVSSYDPDEVAELYELREVLEARATRRAAEGPKRDLSQLEALLAEAETVKDDPEQLRFYQLDLDFHRTLNGLGGNRHLMNTAARVHRQIQSIRIRYAVHLPGQTERSHRDHRAILEAIRRSDADEAERLMAAHIYSVRDAVLDAIRRHDLEPAG